MEQELVEIIIELLPKIKDRNAKFSEEELVPIKTFWEEITKVSIGNLLNCGGHLCEDVRRSITNYMRSYKHVSAVKPEKVIVSPKKTKKIDPKKVTLTRDELMAQCIEIAEAKTIKKPHYKAGIPKLVAFIKEHK